MSRGVARLNDKTIGDCAEHGSNIAGRIITASGNTSANGRTIARLGDRVKADCGHEAKIITASGDTSTNTRGTARLNDKVGESPYTGKIVTASANTFNNQ
jgi:uncharacterized Zn-binding protein involved in type VI secretion